MIIVNISGDSEFGSQTICIPEAPAKCKVNTKEHPSNNNITQEFTTFCRIKMWDMLHLLQCYICYNVMLQCYICYICYNVIQWHYIWNVTLESSMPVRPSE